MSHKHNWSPLFAKLIGRQWRKRPKQDKEENAPKENAPPEKVEVNVAVNIEVNVVVSTNINNSC